MARLARGANDWPQWRGADRSGIATEKDLAADWSEGGPKELWRVKGGIGFASPIAVAGRVYLYYCDGGEDVLEALDAKTGKSVWRQGAPTRYDGQYPGTRCTPVVDGDRIYTYSAGGELTARELADGKQIWTLDALKETKTKQKAWGIASTPVIDGDQLYVQVGEGGPMAIAVDKKDGRIAWQAAGRGGGYASPVVAKVQGERCLLLFGHTDFVALEPDSGRARHFLKADWETQFNVNAALPVVSDGRVFLSVAYGNGHCGAYDLTTVGPVRKWGGKQVTCRFQPGIVDGGHLYVNSEGTLKCVRWWDGEVVWPKGQPAAAERRLLGIGGSIVRFGGDRLICLSDVGTLSLVKATPEKLEVLRSLKRFVEGDQVWSTPLIYDGKLYLKGKEELSAYDIGVK